MPAISFSTMKGKLLSGEKKQTIRPYSDWWMDLDVNSRLVGYWKLHTKEREKLFDSMLIEKPFSLLGIEFTEELMIQDGFQGLGDALDNWFKPHYSNLFSKLFVVLRWL